MKTRFLVFPLIAAAVTQTVMADPPKKEMLSKYNALSSDSPFTRKPDPPIDRMVNPFEDYVLSGVSPVDGGYFVILQNKKKPEERKVIRPGSQDEFRVVEVRRGTTGPLSTTVMLTDGVKSGEVKFDEKFLTLSKPAQKNPNQGQPGQPGQQHQGQPNQGQPNQQPGQQPQVAPGINPAANNPQGGSNNRPPRQRVIPPPAPTR